MRRPLLITGCPNSHQLHPGGTSLPVHPCEPIEPLRMTFHSALLRSTCIAAFALLGLTRTTAQGVDDCSQVVADPLAIGGTLTWTGDNTNATLTGDFAPGSVLESFGIPVMWHAFTTTACADITIDYCGSPSVFVDFWNVLATTCPATNALVVTQLYEYTSCGDGNPTMNFNNLPAGTYLFPVWTAPGSAFGPYVINVSAEACGGSQAPPNDQCGQVTADALAVGDTLTFTGDNTNATATNDFAQGSPFAGAPVVWHAFTTTSCANVEVRYCGQSPVWENSFGFLSTNCPADTTSLVFFSTYNDTTCADGNRTYVYTDLAAGTYYIPVLLDAGNNAVGTYTIDVLATECDAPPTYTDFCADAIAVTLNVDDTLTFTGDNTNATPTADWAPGSVFTGAPVVWHKFTTVECATVTLSYCGLVPTWDNVYGFLATSCPADSIVVFSTFNTTDCADGNYTYIFEGLAAGTYLLPVVRDANNNAIGPYSLQVTAVACAGSNTPPNDNCATAVPEALEPGAPLTFTGDNTGATSTGDWVTGSPFFLAPVVWHAFSTDSCMDVTVSYCGATPVWGNAYGILATGCPADSVVYFSTFNDTACGDQNLTYYFFQLAAGTYLLPVVLDADNNAIGPYSITVDGVNCINTGLSTSEAPSLGLFPNPTSGVLNVLNPGTEAAFTLEVLDMAGRAVHAERARIAQGASHTVQLHRLAPGTYTLRATTPQARTEQRFVIH